MQTKISVFQFQAAQSVRVEIKNGEPWFCLKDVAEILEVKVASPERFNLKASGVEKISIKTTGGKQDMTFINEPNLYRVIFRSNKPEAVKFQDWIFEEVILQIRKTGGYQIQTAYINPKQKQQIREAVAKRVNRTGEAYQAVYHKLHAFMRVNEYSAIKAADFDKALAFLSSIENAPAKPDPVIIMQFTEQEISQFAVVTYYLDKATRQLKDLSEPLKAIGARQQGVEARTLWLESQGWLRGSKAAIQRVQTQIQNDYFRAHTAETLYRMDNLACMI